MSIETKNDLLKDLGLEDLSTPTLDALIEGESRYVKDLRMSLSGIRRSKELNAKEQALIALAIANNNHNKVLEAAFQKKAEAEGASKAEVAEALACTSLLSANNVLYRFRHFMGKETYDRMPAGLRMNIMMNPVLGKEFFELMSTAISAVNGCEACVRSHESSLLKLDSKEKRIFDAVRLAAIITSLGKVIY
ncbi:MAG: alkylhydroperoxidase [Aureispira sp.]|nr:alkylhydroperoxidase [Aureispira sp.]